MARKRKLLVPEAREALNRLTIDVLQNKPSDQRTRSEEQGRAQAAPNIPAALKKSVAQGSMVDRLVHLAKEQRNSQR